MNRIFLLLPALLVACGGKDDPDGTKDPVATPANDVRGYAASPSSGERSGQVSAWSVSNGELRAVSESAAIDADGRYALALEDDAGSAVIIQAIFDDGSEGAVIVVNAANDDGVAVAAPMSVETTGEAGIFTMIATEGGEADVDDTASMLRAVVDADVAAAYSTSTADARSEVAMGISAAVAAWESAGDAVDEDRQAAGIAALVEATIDADAYADARADDGGGEADVGFQLLLDALYDGGASRADVSYMAAASLEAWFRFAGKDEVSDAVSTSFARVRAELATEVVADAWSDLGSTEGTEDADDAEDALFDDLDLDSGDEVIDLESAFDAYAAEVQDALGDAFGIAEAVQLSAVLDGVLVARDEMEATIDGAGEGEIGATSGEAVMAFRAAVSAEATDELSGSGDFTDVQIRAIAEVLTQVYVNGG